MSDLGGNSANPAVGSIRHYADILSPLFWHDDFYRIDRMFEWACILVRAVGLKDTGWDSYNESLAPLDDLTRLQGMALPPEKFTSPKDTRASLVLISYGHVIEMCFPPDSKGGQGFGEAHRPNLCRQPQEGD
jgi:hypothetical protein